MSKPVVVVVGDSGTGKSSMIETLPTNKTVILNLENKPLPMRNFSKFKNIMVTSFKQLDALLDKLNTKEYIDEYDYVVLDSFTSFVEIAESYANKAFKGYEVWGQYNEMAREITRKLKLLKQQVFIIALPEQKAEQFGETKSYVRIKGKELKYGYLEKEVAIVLFTNPKYDMDTGEMLDVEMFYKPNKFNSAKSPRGMFNDVVKNDALSIAKSIDKYYGND